MIDKTQKLYRKGNQAILGNKAMRFLTRMYHTSNFDQTETMRGTSLRRPLMINHLFISVYTVR